MPIREYIHQKHKFYEDLKNLFSFISENLQKYDIWNNAAGNAYFKLLGIARKSKIRSDETVEHYKRKLIPV